MGGKHGFPPTPCNSFPFRGHTVRRPRRGSTGIQGYDLVEPQDIPTIQQNSKLKVLDRPAFNVAYVTINEKVKPFDNPLVRQAVAYGLDRAGVVKAFYAGRGEVANEFMPPQVLGYAKNVAKYSYNPTKARQLLQQAGLTLPVEVEFWYPTDVSRPYMPGRPRTSRRSPRA